MQVFKYWHKAQQRAEGPKGRMFDLTCWGGSSTSPEDAKVQAKQKLERWIQRLINGQTLDEYEYASGRLREELIEEITDPDGRVIGAITRNRYGALVLNSASVFIADIDVPKPGFIDRLLSLFGRKPKDKSHYVAQVRQFSDNFPDYSLVVYETHSGLRVFITGDEFEPRSENAVLILERLGSDAMYRKLCLAQQSYRARLTPKPWRCGVDRPPNSFPRETHEQQAAFDKWLDKYNLRSKAFAVCRPMAEMGPPTTTDAARRILNAHDAVAVNDALNKLA